jgi:hypothetical protein
MSGSSYREDHIYTGNSYTSAGSDEERDSLREEREKRIKTARESVSEKSTKPRSQVNHQEKYDSSLVQKKICQPAAGVKRVYIILIDNSGSNEFIASHFRKSSEYLQVNLNLIDPSAQFVFVYFSDHCDGDRYWQPVNFIFPDDNGEKILISTLNKIVGADGGDAAEAHECALYDACQINFGDAIERHLIMVSDVVGHYMGMDSDTGCCHQQDWKEAVNLVDKTFTSFEFIGCGNRPSVGELQKQFINLCHPELLYQNFINLSYIQESVHRLGIVLNTFLFLVARRRGIQSLEGFLARLYEKWLNDPIFGDQTDSRAKEAIIRFAQFIPGQSSEIIDIMSRVLSITKKEVERLIKQGATNI